MKPAITSRCVDATGYVEVVAEDEFNIYNNNNA